MAEETVTPGGGVISQVSFSATQDDLLDALSPFVAVAQRAELEFVLHYLPDRFLLLSNENPSQTTTPIQQAGN